MHSCNVVKLVSVSSGESGLGKSTLINSLFLTDLYSKDYPGPSQRIKKTVQVSACPIFVFIVRFAHQKQQVSDQ